MRLLVTNDDNIESPFLHALVHALRDAGHELCVVAPKREQSWIGAAKSRHRPVTSEPADRGFNCPTWIVDGTPADCVNIALAHLLSSDFSPEGVVSGMNIGCNASLGFVIASGTIAGAWEGALHGLPAIAFSQDLAHEAYDALRAADNHPDSELTAMLRVAAAHAARLTGELLAATAPKAFIVHNVNLPYPCKSDAVVRRTVPAQVVVPGLFGPAADDGTHRFIYHTGSDVSPAAPLTDKAALAAGYISHTVLDYTRLGVG